MLFRRRKPLHERLAEQGGLVAPATPSPRPPWDHAGAHGVPRPRRWDAVGTITVPRLAGDERDFVVLDDDTVLGEDGDELLAEAVDLPSPFRAEAVRRHENVWAVAAVRIAVAVLEDDPGGEVVEVVVAEGERTLLVDGARSFGSVPALERLLEGDGVVHAERLDETLWEVRVSAL